MQDLKPRITAILHKYIRNPAELVVSSTTLGELDIDELDLPMISLDIEEMFDVTIQCDAGIDDSITVGCLIARTKASLEAKASQLPRLSRPKRSWVSTRAELGRPAE